MWNDKTVVWAVVGPTVVILGLIIALIVYMIRSNKAFRAGIAWAEAQPRVGMTDKELKQLCLNYWAWRHHQTAFDYDKLKDTPFRNELDDWFKGQKNV